MFGIASLYLLQPVLAHSDSDSTEASAQSPRAALHCSYQSMKLAGLEQPSQDLCCLGKGHRWPIRCNWSKVALTTEAPDPIETTQGPGMFLGCKPAPLGKGLSSCHDNHAFSLGIK